MKALWHIDDNLSTINTVLEEEDLKDKVKLKSLYSMISTGTERLVATEGIDAQFEDKMNVPYQEGTFELPIKYGYSLVVKDPDGRIGHIMHPHQDEVIVNPKDVFWTDGKVPPKRLTLLSNMETIVNAIWDADIQPGMKIGICGFGNIGSLLATTLLHHFDIKPLIIEKKINKLFRSEDLGFTFEEFTKFDIIFHTTGTGNGLNFCFNLLKIEGKVIELSWYGKKKITLSLGSEFHYNRLSLISSQVSLIPIKKRDEYDYLKRKQLAYEWLKHDAYDNLIEPPIPFKEAPNFFAQLRKNKQGNGLIYIIKY